MHSGNFAEAQLRALIDVAAAAAGADRLEEVLELAAERALEALGGWSLSISRWDAETGILRTLVNVGNLGPGEERFPSDEVYSVEDYPGLKRLMGEAEFAVAGVDDPSTDESFRNLLVELGKEGALSVKMVLEGRPWGELEVLRDPGSRGSPRRTPASCARSRTSSSARSTARSCSPRWRRSRTPTR